MRLIFCLVMTVAMQESPAAVLHTGHGQRYAQLADAAAAAVPGDTIYIHNGVYPGDVDLNGLKGAPGRWVSILAESPGKVTFRGGTSAWRASSIAWLHIEGFVFSHQTGNGINFDDGARPDSPAHHLHFRHCVFRDIVAQGNNDLLKLSGVRDFTIEGCVFENGARGGSGVDMVGCRDGRIAQCRFADLGANALQMKGGSSNIIVEACHFRNAGSRAINLGGSTGAAFFRPAGARFEATRLSVRACVFEGSDVPVAFVGCTDSEVVQNTIYLPRRWAIRILQENKDTVRFAKCARNVFRNNIIYVDDQLRTACSTGAGTSPETFVFSHNLWFHATDRQWQGPQLPAPEPGGMYGKDPQFAHPLSGDFSILPTSPAAGAGSVHPSPLSDYRGNAFRAAPSVGAFEVKP